MRSSQGYQSSWGIFQVRRLPNSTALNPNPRLANPPLLVINSP